MAPTPEKNLKELIAEREQTVLAALQDDGDMSIEEISHITGIPISATYRIVMRLHKKQAIHVHKWKRPDGAGPMTRIYRAGPGTDRPKPPQTTAAERNRAYRKRRKAEISVRRSKERSIFNGPWGALMATTHRSAT